MSLENSYKSKGTCITRISSCITHYNSFGTNQEVVPNKPTSIVYILFIYLGLWALSLILLHLITNIGIEFNIASFNYTHHYTRGALFMNLYQWSALMMMFRSLQQDAM
jgi:hypothetical protein